jgi:coenzyme F420 hydrogenase subunit beta
MDVFDRLPILFRIIYVRRNYLKARSSHVPEFAKRIIAQYQLPKI